MLHVGARRLARDPLAHTVRKRHAAIETHRDLDGAPTAGIPRVQTREEAAVQLSALPPPAIRPRQPTPARDAAARHAGAVDARIRIEHDRIHDARDRRLRISALAHGGVRPKWQCRARGSRKPWRRARAYAACCERDALRHAPAPATLRCATLADDSARHVAMHAAHARVRMLHCAGQAPPAQVRAASRRDRTSRMQRSSLRALVGTFCRRDGVSDAGLAAASPQRVRRPPVSPGSQRQLPRDGIAPAPAPQMIDFLAKGFDVLEAAVHGCEAHVSDFIEVAAAPPSTNSPTSARRQLPVLTERCAVCDRRDSRLPRSSSWLDTGRFSSALSEAIAQLRLHRMARGSRSLLTMQRHHELRRFERREPFAALPDIRADGGSDCPSRSQPRIVDLGLDVIAERAVHGASASSSNQGP